MQTEVGADKKMMTMKGMKKMGAKVVDTRMRTMRIHSAPPPCLPTHMHAMLLKFV